MRAVGFVVPVVAIFLVCALVGFYSLFSNFRSYDDEGLLLLSSSLYLEGHVFYRDIPWIYGPFYLAVVEFLHGLLKIPLEHSAIRFITLLNWLLLAWVSALLVAKLTSSRIWGLTAFVLTFGYVDSIVNEPGHPQTMVATGAVLMPLLATYASKLSVWMIWLLLGFTSGIVLHLKLNAGAFSAAAVLVVLLCQYNGGVWKGTMRALVVVGSLLFPFGLMWPLLSELNCLAFAALIGVSAAAVCVSIEPQGDALPHRRPALLSFSLGLLAASLLALLYSSAHGASPLDIIRSLLGYREGQNQYYHFFRYYSALQLALACVSAALACIIAFRHKHASTVWSVWAARAALAVMACYALAIDSPVYAQAMLGFAGPWVWVILVNDDDGYGLARKVLAATAVWSPMLAYPIPGSQLYFGSLAILLVALVNLADVGYMLHEKYMKPGQSQWLSPWTVLVFLGVLAQFVIVGIGVRSKYLDYAPLALPGTDYIRIGQQRGKVLRQLVEAIDSSDVVLTTFRFNSLYFWSDAVAPVPTYISHAPLAFTGKQQQAQLRQALESAQSPSIVTRLPLNRLRPESDLIHWIDQNFEPYRKIGGYTVLQKASAGSSGK